MEWFEILNLRPDKVKELKGYDQEYLTISRPVLI